MKTYTRDETDHQTEYVTLSDAMAEVDSMRERAEKAEERIRRVDEEASRIIRGYGNTGNSPFTTPVSVMLRLRDEIDTLRKELQGTLDAATDWFIACQEAKTQARDFIESARFSANADTFRFSTPEEIDEWLAPWIAKLNAIGTEPPEPQSDPNA